VRGIGRDPIIHAMKPCPDGKVFVHWESGLAGTPSLPQPSSPAKAQARPTSPDNLAGRFRAAPPPLGDVACCSCVADLAYEARRHALRGPLDLLEAHRDLDRRLTAVIDALVAFAREDQ
jgi:hypothetical protein